MFILLMVNGKAILGPHYLSSLPWRRWRSGGIIPSFLTSSLEGSEWSTSRPCRYTPKETTPGTHCKEGWVSPRACWDVVEKRRTRCPYWNWALLLSCPTRSRIGC
jgi:hypothetical protein